MKPRQRGNRASESAAGATTAAKASVAQGAGEAAAGTDTKARSNKKVTLGQAHVRFFPMRIQVLEEGDFSPLLELDYDADDPDLW